MLTSLGDFQNQKKTQNRKDRVQFAKDLISQEMRNMHTNFLCQIASDRYYINAFMYMTSYKNTK